MSTSAGEFPRHEYRLRTAGRAWTILHTGEVLTHADEQRFLNEQKEHVPYGVVLWPAAIVLAHEVLGRGDAFRGTRVLELGAGTGLPSIVAASFGGRVLLSDPFRAVSLRLLVALEADGWSITLSKWNVGEEATPRPIGVFELVPPQ